MSKTKLRSGIAIGMFLSGKRVKIMRDRRNRRPKDARKDFKNETWG